MPVQKPRTMTLRDGRTLEYIEFGDPEGIPALYFHGYFGSFYQAMLVDRYAREEHLRIIATNRPGVGNSSPASFKVMTDYAGDIEQLLDHLGLKTCAILGASAGGCFALACAYALPSRVRMAGVAGCIGPMSVMNNLQQMKWMRRSFLGGCHGHPRLWTWILGSIFAFCSRYPNAFYRFILATSTGLDSSMQNRGDILEILWLDYECTFLQPNGIQALLLEAHLYFHWGFDLRKFPKNTNVLFLHGRTDRVITFTMMKELVRPIPHAQLIFCPGGHLTYLMKRPDIVLSLIKNEWFRAKQRFAQNPHRLPVALPDRPMGLLFDDRLSPLAA